MKLAPECMRDFCSHICHAFYHYYMSKMCHYTFLSMLSKERYILVETNIVQHCLTFLSAISQWYTVQNVSSICSQTFSKTPCQKCTTFKQILLAEMSALFVHRHDFQNRLPRTLKISLILIYQMGITFLVHVANRRGLRKWPASSRRGSYGYVEVK